MNRGNALLQKQVKSQKQECFGGKTKVTKEELEELYITKKLSRNKIAKLLHLGNSTISALFKECGVTLRTRSEEGKLIQHPIKYKISKAELEHLYLAKKLSAFQIARQFGCSATCIFNKLKRYGVPCRDVKEAISLTIPRRSRSISKAINKYEKRDFDGSDEEKAYLIGFRLGDLNVRKNKYGATIFIASGTTKKDQLDLMTSLFQKYGKTNIYALNEVCKQFCCNLNMSFDFLLPKEDKIPEWILTGEDTFSAFFAGYIDAEGHFGIYNNFAEFSVASYDKNILFSAYLSLNKFGILCGKPKVKAPEGHVDKRGVVFHGTTYRLRVTRKKELLKLIGLVKPHVKHANRMRQLLKAEANIIERNKRA